MQFMRFNSLFQLLALQRDRSPLLDVAETLLLMPDLFHYFFTGIKVNEFTDASTSQMYDPTREGLGARRCCKAFGLPTNILGTIVPAGDGARPAAPVGGGGDRRRRRCRWCAGTHDTGSAVAAVPARGESWATSAPAPGR